MGASAAIASLFFLLRVQQAMNVHVSIPFSTLRACFRTHKKASEADWHDDHADIIINTFQVSRGGMRSEYDLIQASAESERSYQRQRTTWEGKSTTNNRRAEWNPWQSLSSNVQRSDPQPIGCFIIIDLPLRVWTDTHKASNKSINYWCSCAKLIVDDKAKIGKERWQFLEEGWLEILTKLTPLPMFARSPTRPTFA